MHRDKGRATYSVLSLQIDSNHAAAKLVGSAALRSVGCLLQAPVKEARADPGFRLLSIHVLHVRHRGLQDQYTCAIVTLTIDAMHACMQPTCFWASEAAEPGILPRPTAAAATARFARCI